MENTKNVEEITNPCPRCGGELLTINNQLTKWITCPKCRFKKLESLEKRKIQIRSLR
jgi:DNA-directed RNA polymerase subunit RPC12/RpoP